MPMFLGREYERKKGRFYFLQKHRYLFFILILNLHLVACKTTRDSAYGTFGREDINHLKTAPEKIKSASTSYVRKVKKTPKVIHPSLENRVSIIITEEVPIKDALIELAQQSNINLQMDSKVTERIIYSAHNQPYIKVINDICEMVGLRYKIQGQSVRIEIDTPYTINYKIPFLNINRVSENRISIATDVFTSIKDNKSSMDNGSNSTISAKGNNDFWNELDGNLKIILGDSSTAKDKETKSSNYSLHRQGGLVSVYGTQRQHRLVEDYLETLRQAVATQVLIEAKVIEVSLKDQYKAGINWQKLTGGAAHFDLGLGDLAQRSQYGDPASAQIDMLTFGLSGKNFTGILKAIEEFGTSRTLSSPRLTVMNNQTSILKVAQNQVYFRLNYDKQLNLAINRENISVSSDIQTVPIGLVMSVQPAIDRETGDIILSLRPTISRLTHSVSDPAVEIAYANAKAHSNVKPKPSLIPVVEVREIDSVLRLKSGEIAVLGGLMESRSTNATTKVPVVGDIPLLGQLFTSSADSDEVIELVILLRASIIEDPLAIEVADQRIYEEYTDDPRPLRTYDF
jgi:MSHA type pilus biogenesis protein MshL